MYKNLRVLLFVLSLSGLLHAQRNFEVQVTDFAFVPRDITVTAGDTITFRWVKGFHTTTSDSTTGVSSWNAPITSSAPVYKKVLTAAGLHRYYCQPHGAPGGVGMAGTIQVNPAPVTSVKESGKALVFELGQNYPNPFNPTTRIEYSIPEATNVTLSVFNAIGEEVASLINRYQEAGNYSVIFDAANLPSGMYFYNLKSANNNLVKKMILVR